MSTKKTHYKVKYTLGGRIKGQCRHQHRSYALAQQCARDLYDFFHDKKGRGVTVSTDIERVEKEP